MDASSAGNWWLWCSLAGTVYIGRPDGSFSYFSDCARHMATCVALDGALTISTDDLMSTARRNDGHMVRRFIGDMSSNMQQLNEFVFHNVQEDSNVFNRVQT